MGKVDCGALCGRALANEGIEKAFTLQTISGLKEESGTAKPTLENCQRFSL